MFYIVPSCQISLHDFAVDQYFPVMICDQSHVEHYYFLNTVSSDISIEN